MLNKLKEECSLKLTENGAIALRTTGDYRLDWFAESGSMRNLADEEIINRFMNVLSTNKLDAMKLLFFTRDVLGLGERRTARVVFKFLANYYPELLMKNIHLIPAFGRWDDLIHICIDTKCESAMIDLIKVQLDIDLASEREVSLLGKWMPSVNTSSKDTKALARKLCKKLGLSEKEYRKMLSTLRAKIKVTETLMSANRWSEIEYNRLTSKNNLLYAGAFRKHDKERYTNYLDNVSQGTMKMNVATLYPYEITRQVMNLGCENKEELNLMWNNLPNYIPQDKDIIAVVDVSGSMFGSCYNNIAPIDIAISLGLICARQMNGKFKNHFITFSSNPKLVEIPEHLDLYDTVRFMSKSDWGMSTDLEKVFNLLLNTAIKHNFKSEDMPNIVVISDMEINECSGNYTKIFAEAMREKFNSYGYTLPKITWWNVDATSQTFLASKDSEDMTLVSGASPLMFDLVARGGTPMDMLNIKVLDNVRYDCITV